MEDRDAILGTLTKNFSTSSQRQILRYFLQSVSRRLLPDARVAECHRRITPGRRSVDVFAAKDLGRAYYRGLIVCGSVWACPVCASRIAETRRADLASGLGSVPERPVLVTFTLRHSVGDGLQSLNAALRKAYHSTFSGRWYESFRMEWGLVGSVRALEVTYGQSGWHPHYHVLMLIDPGWDVSEIEGRFLRAIRLRWNKMLIRQGYDASWEHGVTAKPAFQSVAEYVAKWGHEPIDELGWAISHEIAKGTAKLAHADGKTPFQLLWDCGHGDVHAGDLFCEYVLAFRGCHQLDYSSGLRAYMGLTETEPSEEEISESTPASAVLLCSLSADQWRVVVHSGRRGELLEVAAKGDIEELWTWLLSVGVTFIIQPTAEDILAAALENAKITHQPRALAKAVLRAKHRK